MMKVLAFLTVLVVFLAFSGLSGAAENEDLGYVAVYGKVVAYEAGMSIAVNDEEGIKHDFTIMEDTEVIGEIAEGVSVEVEAESGVAVYILVSEE
jgi:hypothetical protein